jgi:hypothetical protein
MRNKLSSKVWRVAVTEKAAAAEAVAGDGKDA